MNKIPHRAATIAASVALTCLAATTGAHAAEATDPVRANVFAGAGYEDNLFRFEGESEAEARLGTDELADWYRYAGAGFQGNFAGDERRFELDGEIYRQTYDMFDFLDHTGGRLNAGGEWELSSDTRGNLRYGYQRRLQSFTNQDSSSQDIIQQHRFEGGIERTLAERWQIRFLGGWRDLNFSNSDFLDKQRLDAEAELQYAASQNSIFGLLATWTDNDFDSNDDRDFTGWSLGPSFEWQITTSFQLSANLGYTRRELDNPAGLDDYDGVTGYVSSLWAPGDRFSSELRVFRDVSNLGGEVSEYAERTGLRWMPVWQMTPRLAGRFSFTYEERDFAAVESNALDRTDDFLLGELWLDYDITRRLLLSLGYSYETRDSNDDAQEFDAHIFRGEIRFNF